ncbi:MAG: tRNA pseudouridine(38-40) synthase TruA [Phycisphaerae bacterium]|nr:tRNA pseudouridine(38-40) synthase TruA [Phycisphaerae bacterium]
MSRRKIRFTIAYDGTDYHGWQVQPGVKTVQEALCQAATGLIGRKVHVHGASRTDAGVHALGQVGLIETVTPIPVENFPKALNDRLPHDIAVLDAAEPSWDFDLIGDVRRKLYRYTIHTGLIRPVLGIRYCWHLPARIDVEAMHTAAQSLVGTHDFRSFASAADRRESSVRTVFRCDVIRGAGDKADDLYVEVEGDGFLYNMVRNIVGTLVDIGHGRWEPRIMAAILEARDRTAAGQLAPASGLCLVWIRY